MKVPGVQRVRDRFARPPREADDVDRVPVRFRVARAVGTAASAIPESRAVKLGTAAANVIAAHPNIVRAGLTAASAVPVLRPYVKVAVAATSAIAVVRRLAEAKSAATDVVSTLRSRPDSTTIAHAGNEFGLGSAAEPIVEIDDKAAPATLANPAAVTALPADPTAVPAQPANATADAGKFANPAAYRARSANPVADTGRYANPAAYRARSASAPAQATSGTASESGRSASAAPVPAQTLSGGAASEADRSAGAASVPAQAQSGTAAASDRPEEVDRPTLLQRMHRRSPRASRGTDAATSNERGREP